jgi:hypothetical protein
LAARRRLEIEVLEGDEPENDAQAPSNAHSIALGFPRGFD